MNREIFLADDSTLDIDHVQVGSHLGENTVRIAFDADYLGLTEAFLIQGVTLAIIRGDKDAVIIHHPDAPFLDEFQSWFDKTGGDNE